MLAKRPKGAVERKPKSSGISGLIWMLVGSILTIMIGVFLYLSPVFNFTPVDKAGVDDKEHEVQPKINTDTDNPDYEFYDVLPSQEMATIPDESMVVEGENSTQNGNAQNDDVEVPPTFKPDVVVETQAPNNPQVNSGAVIQEQTTIQAQNDDSVSAANGNQIVVVEENETYDAPPKPEQAEAQAVIQTAAEKTYILQINSFGNADEADQRRAQVLMAGVDAQVVKNTTANGVTIYQVISRRMTNRQAVIQAQQKLQNNGIDSLIVELRR